MMARADFLTVFVRTPYMKAVTKAASVNADKHRSRRKCEKAAYQQALKVFNNLRLGEQRCDTEALQECSYRLQYKKYNRALRT